MLNGPDELRGLQKGVMSTGIKPRITAAELNNVEFANFEVVPVDVGNFKFASSRRAKFCCDIDHLIIVEVKSGHCPIGKKLRGLLHDVDGLFALVEL